VGESSHRGYARPYGVYVNNAASTPAQLVIESVFVGASNSFRGLSTDVAGNRGATFYAPFTIAKPPARRR
jgi:hypothetical protein